MGRSKNFVRISLEVIKVLEDGKINASATPLVNTSPFSSVQINRGALSVVASKKQIWKKNLHCRSQAMHQGKEGTRYQAQLRRTKAQARAKKKNLLHHALHAHWLHNI